MRDVRFEDFCQLVRQDFMDAGLEITTKEVTMIVTSTFKLMERVMSTNSFDQIEFYQTDLPTIRRKWNDAAHRELCEQHRSDPGELAIDLVKTRGCRKRVRNYYRRSMGSTYDYDYEGKDSKVNS